MDSFYCPTISDELQDFDLNIFWCSFFFRVKLVLKLKSLRISKILK